MNLNQLETLIAVSQTMSFRKAGEQLNLTQPAVSAQIKSLEDELQTVLVDRSQPLTLTDSGKLFLKEAKQILEMIHRVKMKIADMQQTPQGDISLGTTTSIAMQVLPRVLTYFQDHYPKIKTKIRSMHSSDIMTGVEEGLIDIGIGYLSEHHPGLETSVLYYDTFELIVSPQHPLSSMPHASIHALHGLPMVMLSPETAGRKYVDAVLQQFGVVPEVLMELSSSEEVKRMVELNLGAAIVSKSCLAKELKLGTVKMIRVRELDKNHPVGLMYKSGRYLGSALDQFINDLKGMPEASFLGTE